MNQRWTTGVIMKQDNGTLLNQLSICSLIVMRILLYRYGKTFPPQGA